MFVTVYPIYGIVFGFSYWNSDMDEFPQEDEQTKEHAIQLTLGIIGVTFTIWNNNA